MNLVLSKKSVYKARSLSDLAKSTANSSDLARFRPEGFLGE